MNLGVNLVKQVSRQMPDGSFCKRYWQDAVAERVIRQTGRESVSQHGYLNSINHHFITGINANNMDKVNSFTDLTPRQMITQTDMEFKELAPLERELHTYRCLAQKPEFFSEYPMYKKSRAVKPGDTIMMREYAYATSDKDYAKMYLGDDGGIMYDISIGKGARVSRKGNIGQEDEIVFPRSSMFKCLKTEEIQGKYGKYLKVFLEYIMPNDKLFGVINK